MDKTTLLNTIQTEHARFEALIASLSESQLCAPESDGQWSAKDIMASFAILSFSKSSTLFSSGYSPKSPILMH